MIRADAASVEDEVERVLRSYPAAILARGRAYADTGRVGDVARTPRRVTATVTGTDAYRVALRVDDRAWSCTCPAFDREGRCKHVAALAWTLSTVAAARGAAPREPLPPMPDVFKGVYSASWLFARLPLYAQGPVPHDAEDYLPLADWWWSARQDRRGRRPIAEQLVALAPEVAAALATLREWRPRRAAAAGGLGELRARLAAVYAAHAPRIAVRATLPGPLDDRHPGFSLSFDPSSRTLVVKERPSALLAAPRALSATVGFDARGVAIQFDRAAFAEHGMTDAWDLFALRAMLLALDAPADPAALALARELERPMWDRALEQIACADAPSEAREWRFAVDVGRGLREAGAVELVAYARKPSAGPKAKWKRERFSTLLEEEVSPLERDIARLAMNGGDGPRGSGPGSLLRMGTPLAHDVLRLLARHPRVSIAAGSRAARGEEGTLATIVAGALTMTLEPVRGGALVPCFRVDGDPLPVPITTLAGEGRALYRHRVDEDAIVAVEVPPALRRWIALASTLGDALSFPPEATPKLLDAVQPLLDGGVVALPRSALGEELPLSPAPALRVEWRTDADDVEAVIEVMIKVHPRAPFAPVAAGPTLFTFEDEGRRAYVERDFERERAVAAEAIGAFDVEGLSWDRAVGHARGLEPALALAAFLARGDHGLEVEVKVGRPPTLRPVGSTEAKVVVRRMGAWLQVDGAFGDGVDLSFGELLEAARLAQRYVRAGRGVFVELSAEAIRRLRPIAMAAELAPSGASPAIHSAFGGLLAQARDVFASVRGEGVDLDVYARRLEDAPRTGRGARVPPIANGTLRPYQRDGVAWMLRLATWAPGCVLADDMGLGKTVQTAAVLKARAKLGPALVVSPASVSSNWVAELARFVPSLSVRWYHEDRAAPLSDLGPGEVLVVSYGLLQRAASPFRDVRWSTVVVDEAQYVKNVDARRSDAVRSLPRDFTIALTGTPLENHLGELFSIVDVAFPGLLGEEPRFRQQFRRPIETQRDEERLALLGRLLAPFLLRRTRAEVLEELPPREEITEHVELSEAERRRYLALRNECAKALDRQQRGARPSQLRIALLAALTRLRQMACDPGLVDPRYDGPSSKIARVVELARQLHENGHRALVFSQFTSFLARVRAALLEAGLRVATLTGETPTTERRAIVEAFQSGGYDVFCVSLLAGGTGLNLTRASYVIHLDPWWNPAVEEQATARAHRMGQTEPVTVYRMVARGTIEEAVLSMHEEKRQLASSVLEGKGSPRDVSSAELLDLLRFGG